MGLFGEILLRNDAATYTSEARRRADAARFRVDVLTFHDAGGAPSLVITIEHRNENETAWATAETFSTVTGTGLASRVATGLKERVRLKFEFTAGPTAAHARFAILPPVWDLVFTDADFESWPDDDPTSLDEFVEEQLPDTAVPGSGSNGRHTPMGGGG